MRSDSMAVPITTRKATLRIKEIFFGLSGFRKVLGQAVRHELVLVTVNEAVKYNASFFLF